MTAPSGDRIARLREFQRGRAPEIAVLASDAVSARLSAAPSPAVLLAEVIGVLAGEIGMPARPVCGRCRRTMNTGCRICTHCGHGTRDRRGRRRPAVHDNDNRQETE